MRLQRIKIEGYRSLKSVEWKPEALNVLIGPNASGKSNLLHALQLLPAVVKDELQETILRRGGMAPLLWDGKATELSFSLTVGEADEVLLVRRSASTPRVRTSFPSSTPSMWTTTHRTRSAPSTARVTTCVRLRGALGSSCKAASASQSLACLISTAPVFHIRPPQLAHNQGHLHEIRPVPHHIADEHGHFALSHKLRAKEITDGTPARILMRVWG